MTTLINRHLKIFFKDRVSVFFSLFSVFIIITLYLLFLAKNMTTNLPNFKDKDIFIFLWMFSGIVAVTTATTALGALGKLIEDTVSKKSTDFLITHITSRKLAYSYIYYALIIGLIFTIILLIFGYIYTFVKFSVLLTPSFSLIAIIFLSTLMHTLLFYLIVSRLKTLSAFSGFSTIIGTLIGFLAGIYIPIGILPIPIQQIITLFPTTQVVVLLRDSLMESVLSPLTSAMPVDSYNELTTTLGIRLQWNEQLLPFTFSWLYIIGITLFLIFLIQIKNRR